MAVYTYLNKKDIQEITRAFNLGKLIKYNGIKEGIENTNYFIQTNKKKVILTIFEKRVKDSDVPYFVKYMLALNKERIKCPLPLKNKKNNFIFKVKGKSSIIVSFLNGKAKNNLNVKDCKVIGNELAKLHKASKKIKYKRKNSLGYKEWLKIYKKTKNPNKNEIYNYFDTYKKNIPKNLPMGLIHGDIFPDNIFYYKNKFNGFIDFYFSFYGSYVYEIAIAVNSMCFTKGYFDEKKYNFFIKGYQSIRNLSKLELNSLPIMCLGASIRFYVTRLYDLKFTPKNAKVKRKDPNEYLYKMRYFYTKL